MMDKTIENIAQSMGAESNDMNQTYEHKTIALPDIILHIQKATKIVVLTGAGVSVSSGIPTYRGNDGTWKLGSKNYTPQEIATWSMYCSDTKECWDYFTERYNMICSAKPNVSHHSICELEKYCESKKKSFQLVSQNIDNLHLRGGCSKNICEIHGNMKYVRCTNEHCVGTTKMTRDMIVYKKDIQAFVQRMEATPSVRYLEYTKKYGDPLPDIVSWLKDNETIGDVPLCPKCCVSLSIFCVRKHC